MSSEGRPTGVTFLALLEAIIGLYYLITGFNELFTAAVIRSLMLAGISSQILPMVPRALGTMLIIFGFLSLFLAWGIWTGKGWARMVALVIAVLGIVLSFLSFHLIGLVIDIIIVYYLTRPKVKEFFTK